MQNNNHQVIKLEYMYILTGADQQGLEKGVVGKREGKPVLMIIGIRIHIHYEQR